MRRGAGDQNQSSIKLKEHHKKDYLNQRQLIYEGANDVAQTTHRLDTFDIFVVRGYVYDKCY